MKFKFVFPVILSVIIASCSSDDDPAPNNQASIVITSNTIAAQLVGKWRLDSVRTYNYILNGTGLDNQYVGSKIEFTSNISIPMTGNACFSNYYVNLINLKIMAAFFHLPMEHTLYQMSIAEDLCCYLQHINIYWR